MLMSKKTILQCLSRLIVAATFVLSVAKPASAQYGMDFSIYADFAFDGLTVYGWADGYDNSWGCQHSDYTPFGYMDSPTRSISGSNYLSLSFDGDDGYWSMNGGFSFLCSCIFNYAQAGNSVYSPIQLVPTYVTRTSGAGYQHQPPPPWDYQSNRVVLDQFARPIGSGTYMFINETFTSDPPAASGGCTADYVDQGDAETMSGIFGPDIYHVAADFPMGCELVSLHSFEITYKGTTYPIRTKYGITWRYSGVTIEPIDEPPSPY